MDAGADARLTRLIGRADLRVAGVVALLAAASFAILLALPERNASIVDTNWVVVAVIAVSFGLSEYPTFNVVFRNNGISYSLSEMPLALALVFVSPILAAPVRVVFAAPVLMTKRQNRGMKLAFNLTLYAFEVMFSYGVLSVITSAWGESDLHMVAGVTATLVLASMATSIFISMAIAAHEGQFMRHFVSQIRATWWLYPVASVLGGMTLALALIEPALALLALLPAGGIWYVLNRFGVQNQRLRDLAAIHGFTGRIGRSLDVDEICEIAVDDISESFHASGVALGRFVDAGIDSYSRGSA